MGQGRLTDESGFTLIELLVVVLILGILAAIAIPNFLNQQAKAHDASAKAAARNAQSAMQIYEMDHGNFFTPQVTQAALADIDKSLNSSEVTIDIDTPAAGGYTLNVNMAGSPSVVFSVIRYDNGATSRTCSQPGQGGCHSNGTW